MNQPPPIPRDQATIDREHLELLAIFHYVLAGLAVLGIGFGILHYMIFRAFLDSPEMWKNAPAPPPREFFMLFRWLYVVFGGMLILAAVWNVISGVFLRARKHRVFSLVVAALNCTQIPFGTVLGVFTIVALVRESVRSLYLEAGSER